jgi:2-polyprenyl-3-methyl-5-hydroxy-6-metoxy-1,4-benzoquinol methylase
MKLQLTSTGKCPACRNESGHRLLYQLHSFNVYECVCGLRFIDPSLDEKSMTEIYQSSEALQEINPALGHYYEYETLNPKTKTYRDYSRALEAVSELRTGREILEVGCGRGSFLRVAREQGWKVYGIDSGRENIQALQAEGIDAICSSYLGFATEQRFDVIVLWDLIEHPQNPGAFLEKTRELLNPGGLLLIASPQEPNFLTILGSWIYRLSGGRVKSPLAQFFVMEHTSYFSLQSMKRFLASRGFQVLKKWKTETDLNRYKMSPFVKLCLRVAFQMARILKLENRMIVIARKQD